MYDSLRKSPPTPLFQSLSLPISLGMPMMIGFYKLQYRLEKSEKRELRELC
jgi:hypothetical protein